MAEGPPTMQHQIFTIPAIAKHSATVIFMHGLGDSAQNWIPFLQKVRLPYVKYLCPGAHSMTVTMQQGAKLPAWFDIKSLDFNRYDEDEKSIKHAAKTVTGWVKDEIKAGIASDRIVLSGFSQGGGLAFYTGLAFDQPLGGIFGLSSRVPLHKQLVKQEGRANTKVPVLQCHGSIDTVTPIEIAYRFATILQSLTENHSIKIYPRMGHTSCEQEEKDVKEFLKQCLPPPQSDG